MESTTAFTGSEQAGNSRHLSLRMNTDAAHDVVHRRSNLHRSCGNVDIGELLELMVHTRQLFLDVVRSVRDFFFDPGDVEENTAVRTSPAFLDFAHDATCDMISRQKFGRAARLPVTLAVFPAFFFVVGCLMPISFRNIIKHKTPALTVPQDAAFSAHAFGDQDTRNARRPNHSSGMELHELHIHEVRARVVCQSVTITGILPTITCDLVGASNSACC